MRGILPAFMWVSSVLYLLVPGGWQVLKVLSSTGKTCFLLLIKTATNTTFVVMIKVQATLLSL